MLDESTLLNKIVSAAIIGLLGWNVMSTQKLSVDVEVLKYQTQAVLSTAPSTKDVALIGQRVTRIEEWTSNLSARIKTLERIIIEDNMADGEK